MDQAYRNSGIEVIGKIPWATHFCQFYQTREDLLSTLVPFMKAGLQNKEFCVWVTCDPLTPDDAHRAMRAAVPDFERYLAAGQIEIFPHDAWYTKDGYFDMDRVLKGWIEKYNTGLAAGFEGLRVTGNTAWLEKRDWKSFAEYEAAINGVIGKYRMLVLCTYCLDRCNANELIDVVLNHDFALIKREGKWELVENSSYKATKEALVESEERFRQLAEAMPQLIWVAGASGDTLFLNRQWREYTGKDARTLRERQEVVHPDDLLYVRKRWQKALDSESSFEAEYRMRRHDGEYRWFLVRSNVSRDASGRVLHWTGTATDIHNLKRAEAEMQTLSESRRLLFEITEQVMAEKALPGLLQKLTDAARELTGARIGVTGHGYVDGRFKIGASSRVEGHVPCPPGREFAVEKGGVYLELIQSRESLRLGEEELYDHPAWRGLPANHAPLRGFLGVRLIDGLGRANGVIMVSDKVGGSFTDIDEGLLKQLGAVASLALQHIEARESAESKAIDLEAANKELESFSYSVSHDLRAPLRSLDGFSQALIEDYSAGLDDTARDYLKRIRESSQLMAQLIEDLLRLSRVTRGEMQPEAVNLSDLAAASIIAELRHASPLRQVDCEIQPGMTARGDVKLLRVALENMIQNAWKFTGKNPRPLVQIGLIESAGQRDFFIRDNGAGFDMAYAGKLFAPFQRLHRASEYPGSGIGLATVQRIIHRHGGRVWAEAQPGKGATFFFTIPEGK